VATFPPFLPAGRTIDAVAVIFREQPGTVAGTDLTNKRSSSYSPQPTLLDRFLKNVRCLGPRLAARFGKKPAPVVDYGYGKANHREIKSGYIFHLELSCCKKRQKNPNQETGSGKHLNDLSDTKLILND
jgi:hypothetical protein